MPPRNTDVPASISVLIIDDHELVGTSLTLGLRSADVDAHWSGSAAAGAGILAAAGRLRPGLALLDLDLGDDAKGRPVDGIDLVAPLVAAGWRVLILSASRDQVRVGGALARGAIGWLPKNAPFPSLLRAVRDAAEGRDVMAPERRQLLIALHDRANADHRERQARIDRLTRREREVLARLVEGHRAQVVADEFVVSLATVRTQIRAILGKLEVSSQLEAVAAYRLANQR